MFNELPRYLGFPNNVWVEKQFAFDSFEKTYKGKLPFFVSTFQFKDKNTPIVDNLFFDIDSYFSLRIPYKNIKRLRNWCHDRNIPTVINFSGGKGFHLYTLIKPMILDSEITKQKVRNLMYSVQIAMSNAAGIEAFDSPTYGRIRFLMRYPTSKYVCKNEDTGAFEQNGFYCRYLTDEEFDSGLKNISKLAKEPGIVPKTQRSNISLQQIADMLPNLKMLKRDNGVTEKLLLKRAGSTVPTATALGLPCLQEIIKHSHPTHFERLEIVSWLKQLGYTDIAINAFIKNCNWTRYNYAITAYQVRTVKPRLVSCKFLKKNYSQFCKDCSFKRR